MNTNSQAKRVLIYGDSITWGRVPNKFERYSTDIRFTGVVQNLLGNEFEIIEEGLRSRMVKGENPYSANKDGYKHLEPILCSHLPLDMLIIFLGTNDCNLKAKDINEYLKNITELDITAKDFRTWGGTRIYINELSKFWSAHKKESAAEFLNNIVDKVANSLGNTRSVSKNYYINPQVLEATEDNNLLEKIFETDKDLGKDEMAIVFLSEFIDDQVGNIINK